jgi:hypothetical protein
MRIQLAHLNIQNINVAIFNAKPTINTDANRSLLLSDLTNKARAAGLKVEKSAIAYSEAQRVVYYGTPDLVKYLQSAGVNHWTHWIEV